MRMISLRGASLWLGFAILAGPASAQQGFDQPTLLPVPSYGTPARLPATNPIAYRTAFNAPNEAPAEPLPSPSDRSALPRGPMNYPEPPAYGSGVGPVQPSPMSGDYQQAAAGGWDSCGGACGAQGCGPVCNNPWYGYGGGLIMGRANNHNWIPLAYETTTGTDILTTQSSPQKWAGGYEIVLGKYFNCGCNAIEFRWWQLMPGRSQADVFTPNVPANQGSRLDYSGLNYDDGSGAGPQNAGIWSNAGQYHCLVHQFNFYGAEVDLLGGGFGCGACGCNPCGGAPGALSGSRFGGNWITGVRWFHYDEYLRYNTEQMGFGTNGEADELWYEIKTKNDLVGFQMGGQLTYQLCQNFTILSSARFGAYNNHITAWQGIHGGAGTYATFNSGAAAGSAYNITTTTNALAFLGEVDLGVRWQITSCLAARAGYRAMGLSGVATTDDQISRNFACPCDAAHINLGSIALHGMYVGGELCW